MNLMKKCACIICGRYIQDKRMYLLGKIGVCNKCFANFKRTGDMTFEGKGSISMVLSPYLYKGKLCEAVRKFKFSGQWAYGEVFAKLMCKELASYDWISDFDLVLPVPLHEIRVRERGYNQSEILARGFADGFNIPLCSDALFRIRQTKRQSSLAGIDRIKNVEDAFCASGNIVVGKRIILIDDICTMGETLKACADALKRAGADEIIGITLCKAEV